MTNRERATQASRAILLAWGCAALYSGAKNGTLLDLVGWFIGLFACLMCWAVGHGLLQRRIRSAAKPAGLKAMQLAWAILWWVVPAFLVAGRQLRSAGVLP